jgi:hypothetical protein
MRRQRREVSAMLSQQNQRGRAVVQYVTSLPTLPDPAPEAHGACIEPVPTSRSVMRRESKGPDMEREAHPLHASRDCCGGEGKCLSDCTWAPTEIDGKESGFYQHLPGARALDRPRGGVSEVPKLSAHCTP